MTPSPSSTLPPVIDCPGTGEFGEGGGISEVEGQSSDASHLSRISWEVSDLCESFRFEFSTTEGAPATVVPDFSLAHLDTYQVIRIRMDIDSGVITDQLVETGLVDRIYLVRSLDGGMFVDLHLSSPAAARARVQASPAELIVDLRPGFVEFAGEATVSDNTVVVAPSNGDNVGPVTGFAGYSRAFEAKVTIIVTRGDEVVLETSTSGADYLETWGEFRDEVTLPPGEVSVFLGESSPVDGSLEGVIIDLTAG